jgi:hypothetical protein
VLRESVKLFFWPVQIYIRKRAPSFYNAYSAVLAHDLWTEFGHAWLRKKAIDFRLIFAYDGFVCSLLQRSIWIRPLPGRCFKPSSVLEGRTVMRSEFVHSEFVHSECTTSLCTQSAQRQRRQGDAISRAVLWSRDRVARDKGQRIGG